MEYHHLIDNNVYWSKYWKDWELNKWNGNEIHKFNKELPNLP